MYKYLDPTQNKLIFIHAVHFLESKDLQLQTEAIDTTEILVNFYQKRYIPKDDMIGGNTISNCLADFLSLYANICLGCHRHLTCACVCIYYTDTLCLMSTVAISSGSLMLSACLRNFYETSAVAVPIPVEHCVFLYDA